MRAFRLPMHRAEVFDLIKEFAGQSNILTVPVAFIRYAGTLEAALLLSQILYWSDKTEDGWFYKSYKEWEEEISLGEYDVRKAAKSLKDKGVLETRLKKANGAPTVHYRLNEANFSESILQFLKNPICEISRNLDSAKSEESTNNRLPKTTDKRISPDSENPAERVFVCWKETLDHPKARLDAKRRDLINRRIADGYSVDDLCIAIRGCSESPFHMGKNDRNTRYDDIMLICRDAKHVDQFLEIAQGEGNGFRLKGVTAKEQTEKDRRQEELARRAGYVNGRPA